MDFDRFGRPSWRQVGVVNRSKIYQQIKRFSDAISKEKPSAKGGGHGRQGRAKAGRESWDPLNDQFQKKQYHNPAKPFNTPCAQKRGAG